MASLLNTKISNTYVGLIKTIDNAVISSSLRELSDGSGNATGIHLNNAGDFKVTNILEFGSLKDTGQNITISKFHIGDRCILEAVQQCKNTIDRYDIMLFKTGKRKNQTKCT